MKKSVIFLGLLFCLIIVNAQTNVTNYGKEFWVGYAHHQFMETSTDNSQNMTLYFSVDSLPTGFTYATVTVTIDSSGLNPSLWFKRVYHIPANTVISIDNSATPAFTFSPASALSWGPIPKGLTNATASNTGTSYDARLFSGPPPSGSNSTGIFRKKGIHIESDCPIVAYAHIYGSVSSGATMLIPVENWGSRYTTINSKQGDASGAFNFLFVIATKDSTPIKIIPSQLSRLGNLANVPIFITLQKGQIYQYVGDADALGNGVNLTNSVVTSLDPNKPIAVFAGSSRTSGESNGSCTSASRDNDIQQCYPQEIWGKEYITTPFSTATSSTTFTPSVFAGSSYKIVARDSGTMVRINSITIVLPVGSFYQFTNSLPNYITANKPIAVAQFMTSTNCGTGQGDPDMIYLSPLDRGVTSTGFYRTTKEAITNNYVSMIVPNDGLNSLTIDGLTYPFGGNSYVAPISIIGNNPGYSLVVKGWAAARAQTIIKCNKKFTGITYGLGGAESYAYNIGANFFSNSPNNISFPKPIIEGRVFVDHNSNGIKDTLEPYKANVKLQLSNGTFTFTDKDGYYEFQTDSLGSYTVSVVPNYGYSSLPASVTFNFSNLDTLVTGNFALQPNIVFDSISVNCIPVVMNAIQGNPMPYYVTYENNGTTVLSASSSLTYNNFILQYDSCSDVAAIPTASGIVTGTNNMQPGYLSSYIGYFTVNPTATVGDTLTTKYDAVTTSVAAADSIYMIVEGGVPSPDAQRATKALSTFQIAKGDAINYTIYFENLDNDTINKITILDTLSPFLQPNSFKMIGSNFNCRATVKNNVVSFVFDHINLPTKNNNVITNKGFVSFSVKPEVNLNAGTIIENAAYTYYDYKKPAVSKASTIINGVITPLHFMNFELKNLNDKTIENNWKTVNEVNVSHFNIQRGFNGKDFINIGETKAQNNSSNEYRFDDKIGNWGVGTRKIYYRIESVDKDGSKTYSEVRSVEWVNKNDDIRIYPNPTKDNIYIECNTAKEVEIVDYSGRVVKRVLLNQYPIVVPSKQVININIKDLNRGVFIMKVTLYNGVVISKKIIIQ